jgi:predicted chitinase
MNNTDDKVIESSIENNKKLFEELIIDKNKNAGSIISQIHEVGDDPKFHEMGNYSKGKLENIQNNFDKNSIEYKYAKIHLSAREIINETVANKILTNNKKNI